MRATSGSKVTNLRTVAGTGPGPERNRPVGRRLRNALFSFLVIVALGVTLWVQATARALATGYIQAAGMAQQVGRPIPNTIFETGAYRVQALSTRRSDGTPAMTVTVRDRLFNLPLYRTTRSVVAPGNAP